MKPNVFLKNALAVFLPAGLLLTGCSGAGQTSDFAPKLDAAYSVSAALSYGDKDTAELVLTRTDAQKWEAAFSDPPALSGVLLSFDGNAVSASYKGLAFTVPKTALPAKNMLALTTEILDAVSEQKELACSKLEDGTWQNAGECSGGSYTVTFSDDGTPTELEIPSQPLRIVFSGYSACGSAPAGTTAVTGTDTSVTVSGSSTSASAGTAATTKGTSK